MSLPPCTQVCNSESYIVKATSAQNIWKTSLPPSASQTKGKRASSSNRILHSSTGFICLLDNMQRDSVTRFLGNQEFHPRQGGAIPAPQKDK